MSKRMESAAAARWGEIVGGQAQIGLSVTAYCRRVRVPASSFYAWRRKLRDAGTFAEVRVTPEPDSAIEHGALEIHVPRGWCVIVRPGFDRQTLRDLVATLEHDGDGVADREADV